MHIYSHNHRITGDMLIAQFDTFASEQAALDQADLVTVCFQYDKELVELRRDAAPLARFNRDGQFWKMRRDEARNFLRSADIQCTKRGIEVYITIAGKEVVVGCQGEEAATRRKAAELKAAEAKEKARAERAAADAERAKVADEATKAAARATVERLDARKIISEHTVRIVRYNVRTLDGQGSIDAQLVTADGRRIWIDSLLESDEEHQSRRVSVRYLRVPVLSGGHRIEVTVKAPGKKPSKSVVKHEEEPVAA